MMRGADRMIFFTDLDGTLLSDDKTISEGNRAAIREFTAAGGRLVITTGRAVESVAHFAKELSLKETGGYIAAFNGALICDCASDRVLLRHAVPLEVIQELCDEAEKAGIYAQTFCDGKVLAARPGPELERYCRNNRMESVVTDQVAEYINAHPAQGTAAGPQKVMLIALGERERLVRFRGEHMAWEEGRCSSVFSSPDYLEYCPWGVDKGSAVRYLERVIRGGPGCLPGPARTAGVTTDRLLTVAVGDEENDLPMIRAAQIGVAMKNAAPEVKAAADYVTEADHNHDGVAEVIRRFAIGGRP